MGSLDPQIVLLLLRHCASFCKLVHLARSTPPSLVSEGLALFDEEVRCHFFDWVAIDASDSDWRQVQLNLRRGGLGLHRLFSCVLGISYQSWLFRSSRDEFTLQAVTIYNSLVPHASSDFARFWSHAVKKNLSIEDHQFDQMCIISSPANHALMLSVSSSHASSWLAVIPSRGLNLSLEPEEFQVALKWGGLGWTHRHSYVALTALTTSWILLGIML